MPYSRNIISLCTWNVLNTALELKFLHITIIKDRCHYASLNSRIYTQRPFKLDLVHDLLFCTLLWNVTAATAKSLQSCPTLCDPIDGSPPGFPIPGILQTRILEWVAMPSSQGIFLTQGSNLSLPHLLQWQAGSLPLNHLGISNIVYSLSKYPK